MRDAVDFAIGVLDGRLRRSVFLPPVAHANGGHAQGIGGGDLFGEFVAHAEDLAVGQREGFCGLREAWPFVGFAGVAQDERVVGFAKIIAQAEQVHFCALAVGNARRDHGECVTAPNQCRKGVGHVREWRDGFDLARIVRVECPLDDAGRNAVSPTDRANRL